jgi:hypothetical protein
MLLDADLIGLKRSTLLTNNNNNVSTLANPNIEPEAKDLEALQATREVLQANNLQVSEMIRCCCSSSFSSFFLLLILLLPPPPLLLLLLLLPLLTFQNSLRSSALQLNARKPRKKREALAEQKA